MNEIEEIECQGEGCGRMAYKEDEDYYTCGRCGWAGSSNNPVVILKTEVAELKSELRDCHDLLNNCGFEICKICANWKDTEYECANGCEEE